jgi:hypothetical protein
MESLSKAKRYGGSRNLRYALHLASMYSLNNIAEFCYNLEYTELNGRTRGDPWSLRQCGVYQQICLKTHRSCWILLQVPNRARAKLDQALRSHSYKNSSRGVYPMVPHLIFISAMAANWQAYLQHLRSRLTTLVCRSPIPSLKTVLTFLSFRMRRHVSRVSAAPQPTTFL